MSLQFIGLLGYTCSGKNEAQRMIVDHLETQGIPHMEISMSDVLRQEIFASQGRRSYPTGYLGEVAANLRKIGGADFVAEMTLSRIEERITAENFTDGVIVINGMRRPEEVRRFQRAGAYIIGITAGFHDRLERIKKRNRKGDPLTEVAFRAFFEDEVRSKNEFGNSIAACYQIANRVILNDGNKEEDIERFNKEILNELQGLNLERPHHSKEAE